MRMVNGTWESYRTEQERIFRLRDAAVEATISLANTPNRRFYKGCDITAIKSYLAELPDVQHKDAIAELGKLAKERNEVQHEYWLGSLIKEMAGLIQGRGPGMHL